MNHRILIVEDDLELAAMVADFLRGQSFDVDCESDGLIALQRIASEPLSAVVLDVELPGMDGISVCRKVRALFAGPIIVVTARGEEADEVISLEVGADDYMAKPVRPKALLARLKMHLARNLPPDSPEQPQRIEASGLVIDQANRTTSIDGKPVVLTTAEFDLLWYLAARAGRVVDRSEIYLALLGLPYDGLDRSIDLRVSRLRKKLGDDPSSPVRVKSVRGVGYMLATELPGNTSLRSQSPH